jgi:type II secretory pathway pseudopilin PulG
MTENDPAHPTPLGIYDKPGRDPISGIEVIAGGLSAAWLIGAAIFFLSISNTDEAGISELDSLRFVITILAIFLPVAMIWVAATAARSARVMREESQRLQTAIDAIRQAYVSQNQNRNTASEPSVARKLDEIAAATRKTESAMATFSSRRDHATMRATKPVAVPNPAPEDQASLALGTLGEELDPPLDRADFIRALNFPETADDQEGFDALRRALRNRSAAQLIQSAQDVLTLLSQDGIYMDDLRPDMARPEIWRQFAGGARGRPVAALGGVRDRSSLALTSGRMKQDPIFRDAAHHFLRIFDKMFTDFEETASDSDISSLSETRTARAFMLLGRVAGTFD